MTTQFSDKNLFTGPFPINKEHNLDAFDCGVSALNYYLQTFALQNNNNGSSKTYVVLKNDQVVGYFSLAFGSVEHERVPPRVSHGLGRYPVPVLIIARLAISNIYQKKGLGKALLKHALLKAVNASDIAGLRAVVVHAKDDVARCFYEKFGFSSSPLDPHHLFLLMKDIRKSYGMSRIN